MEAVALSTATSALNSVVKTATTAITDNFGLLLGVQEELFFIKEELDMMQAFLEAASVEKVKTVVVNRWIKQVQELAFDVEDCLQEASVYLIKKTCLPVIFSVKKRDHIARKIRVLKTRIEDVSQRNSRYNLINKDSGGHTYHESASTRSIANVEGLLVGLEEPKKKLIDLIWKELKRSVAKHKVISVVGMGELQRSMAAKKFSNVGMGELEGSMVAQKLSVLGMSTTTLVKEIYGCPEIRGKFKHFHWITIKDPFNTEEFIESLAKQIPPNPFDDMSEPTPKKTLKEKVIDYLKDKKYFVVLEELSSLSEWDEIKDVLPLANGCQIIVTTRSKSPVAETITHPSENIYDIYKLSEKDDVDLFEPKRKLIDLILKEHVAEHKVISVVGMGGLGKTTLVKEIYGYPEVRDEFKHFAWVPIQHPFNMEEFIESLAKQIPSNPFDNMSELSPKKTLKEMVTEYLTDKKYFVVLDDLSSLSEWDKIKDVLPLANGSQIIVTTRYKSPVAETITHPSENIYEIHKLSEKDAFHLFCRVVYKTLNYRLVSDEGPGSTEITEEDSKVQNQYITNTSTKKECRAMKGDPPHESKCSTEITIEDSKVHWITKDMKTEADSIINSCGRLPLAIVTIGNHLATKPKTSVEWKTMRDHLSSELGNNPDLGAVKNVLTSSYDDMPYHLKPCLLYLSVFHNHKEIRRSRIIRQWMADGYIMANRKKTAEEIGKGYFYDLMGRSLVQPSEMSTIVNGNIKRCSIHDMMYELILAKAEDENMVSVLEDENLITMTEKVRHLVIAGGPCIGDKVLERVKLSHMRSLSIIGEVGDYLRYPRMKLLRVLDLEGTLNLKNRDLRSIGKLRHLKYLGLRGTKITELPDSLGKLTELETLDIKNTEVVELPTGIVNLHKLSYLRAGKANSQFLLEKKTTDYFLYRGQQIVDMLKDSSRGRTKATFIFSMCVVCCLFPLFPCFWGTCSLYFGPYEGNYSTHGVRAPQGIGELRSLNILGVIDFGRSKGLAKEMQNLTNLTKLAVSGFYKENGKTLAKVIDGLKHLKSLVLEAADDLGLRCCLDYVSSPPKYLQSLKLYSHLGELPEWISSLENLEKIHFRKTYFRRNKIDVIARLPNLKILYMLFDSFDFLVELRIEGGAFPMLQIMILEDVNELGSMSIEKTALERLEQLKIRKCLSIESVSGLEFLEQLKEMEVVGYYSNSKFVRNLREQLEKLKKKTVLKVF